MSFTGFVPLFYVCLKFYFNRNQEWENGYSHYPGALVVSGIPRLEEKLFSVSFLKEGFLINI